MNLEHVKAVEARIQEIKLQLGEYDGAPGNRMAGAGSTSTFSDVLSRVQSSRSASSPEELEPIIASAAERYNIDPAVIKAVISAESGFRTGAVSRTGALGLMQLMPGTAQALGVDPTDPAGNIDGGTRYLRQQLDRFGSLNLALAAYNAGPGAVMRYDGIPPYAETQRYVQKVLDKVEDYSH
jgi:soluble lytic murein transglycosylase-like protein